MASLSAASQTGKEASRRPCGCLTRDQMTDVLKRCAGSVVTCCSPSDGSWFKGKKGRVHWSGQQPLPKNMELSFDIINDILARKWPYISDWFGKKMKDVLEPLLQRLFEKFIRMTVDVKVETCNLGKDPARLDNIETLQYAQDREGEERHRTNILLLGDLSFEGGEIHITVGTVAQVRVTSFKVTGKLVVELVRLTDFAPWLSGLRVYFPNAPQVEIRLESEIFLLDAFSNRSSDILHGRIADQIKRVIGNYAVLPNAYSIDFNKGADPFQLKHLSPQGVVRLQVSKVDADHAVHGADAWVSEATEDSTSPAAKAERRRIARLRHNGIGRAADGDDGASLPVVNESADVRMGSVGSDSEPVPCVDSTLAAEAVPTQTTRWWSRWFAAPRPRWFSAASPSDVKGEPVDVEVIVGNVAQRCSLDEPLDFFILDRDRQSVLLRVRDGKGNVLGEEAVGAVQLVEGQYTLENQSERRPSERQLQPALLKELRVQSQWRPCAPWGGVSRALEQDGARWCMGEPFDASWVLSVELFHATGLPPISPGTQHWACVELRRRGEGCTVDSGETQSMFAFRPVDRALEILKFVGEFRGQFPAEGLRSDVNWRRVLHLVEPVGAPADAVDVVWDCPVRFLVASDGQPVLEAIKALEIVVTVKRPEGSLLRDLGSKRPAEKTLGQQTYGLKELVSTDDYSQSVVLQLPMADARGAHVGSAAALSMRVHVRPLLSAPHLLHEQGGWVRSRRAVKASFKLVRQAAGKAASTAQRAGTLARQRTQELFHARNGPLMRIDTLKTGASENFDSPTGRSSIKGTSFETPLAGSAKRPQEDLAQFSAGAASMDVAPKQSMAVFARLSSSVRHDLEQAAAAEQLNASTRRREEQRDQLIGRQ